MSRTRTSSGRSGWTRRRAARRSNESLSGRQSIDLAPQRIEIEREAFAAGDTFEGTCGRIERVDIAAVLAEFEHLEAAQLRVDDPVPAHAERGVFVELDHAIAAAVRGRGRDHLDHDVGRCVDDALSGWFAAAG